MMMGKMPAALLLDDLSDIEAMVDLLHMATTGCMDEQDGRVFGVASMQILKMVKALTAKIEEAR